MTGLRTAKDIRDYVVDNTTVAKQEIKIIEKPHSVGVHVDDIPPKTAEVLEMYLDAKTPVNVPINVTGGGDKQPGTGSIDLFNDVVHNTEVIGQLLKQQFTEGLRIRAENKDGEKINGRIEYITDIGAIDYEAGWTTQYDSLYAYWSGDIDVERSDRVIGVEWLKMSSTVYDYPESKIHFHTDGKQLPEVPGVGPRKEEALRLDGFTTILDLQLADQQELAEIEGIGNALAARIKADVGDIVNPLDGVHDRDPDDMAHVGYICPECGESFSKGSPDAIEGDEGEMYCDIDCLNQSYT